MLTAFDSLTKPFKIQFVIDNNQTLYTRIPLFKQLKITSDLAISFSDYFWFFCGFVEILDFGGCELANRKHSGFNIMMRNMYLKFK